MRSSRVKAQEDLNSLLAQQNQIESQLRNAAPNAFTPQGGGGPIRQGSGRLIWPVNGPITSPFCERRAWEACHPGIDIGVPTGTQIHAADSGRVTIAGWGWLRQLHLHPAHRHDVDLLRPPGAHPRRRRRSRSARAR